MLPLLSLSLSLSSSLSFSFSPHRNIETTHFQTSLNIHHITSRHVTEGKRSALMAMMTPRTVAIASSPGRAEKLPAPPGLARLFIRKSRNRGGVLASPMFGVRSRSVGPTGRPNGTEGEEPSSPKVTCIGQVRIKAGKKNKKKKPKPNPPEKCRCLQRALFCGTVPEKKKKKKKNDVKPRQFWPCWGITCCCKRTSGEKRNEVVKEGARGVALGVDSIHENGVRSEVMQKRELDPCRLSNFSTEPGRLSNYNEEPARTSNYARRSITGREEVSDREEEDEEEEHKKGEDTTVCISSATTTPPKNALFLMRCRSAPQHHSRFGPSPVTIVDETMEEVRVTDKETGMGVIMEKKEMEEEKQIESRKISMEGEEEDEAEEEEEEMRCSSARPLVLTRCNSEPASKGEEMVAPVGADMASTSCFWAHSGSGSRQRKMVPGIGHEQRTPSPLPSH